MKQKFEEQKENAGCTQKMYKKIWHQYRSLLIGTLTN
jgi:hypothetical protein